jgi:hypothetical protein
MATVCLVALALCCLQTLAEQRPITDFTSRQMAWCLVVSDQGNLDCSANGYGDGACENGFSLESGDDWFDPKNGFQMKIDRLGFQDQFFFEGAIGTKVDGSASVKSLFGHHPGRAGDRLRRWRPVIGLCTRRHGGRQGRVGLSEASVAVQTLVVVTRAALSTCGRAKSKFYH